MHPKSWTLLEVHIFMSKKGQKQRKYSPEFKTSVIMDMREHRLSYCETVRKYELGSTQSGAAIGLLQPFHLSHFGYKQYTKRSRNGK